MNISHPSPLPGQESKVVLTFFLLGSFLLFVCYLTVRENRRTSRNIEPLMADDI